LKAPLDAALFFYRQGRRVRRKCRSIFRRVPGWHDALKTKRPEMQEHFLTAMDGGNAEIAGANFGRRVPESHCILKTKRISAGPTRRKCRSIF
jgi:hypothetical protein